jgi:signal transduction histidine kinase
VSEVSSDGWGVEREAVLAVAAAEDVDSGMRGVVELCREVSGAAKVEWREEGGRSARVVAGAGGGGDSHQRLSLGPAGSIVVFGGRRDGSLESIRAAVVPVVRRRYAEERLALAALRLARRNEALEEFATLVAHELKAPLQAALAADDGGSWAQEALELVDALLEAARDVSEVREASPARCLQEAVRDLGPVGLEVTSDLSAVLPLPPTPLRVILRNLLRNAAAAGARTVRVSTAGGSGSWELVVEDDGVGLAPQRRYGGGTGLGLRLCHRIARRYGGSLTLAPGAAGGARATLLLRGSV